jgi:hypothetical protein
MEREEKRHKTDIVQQQKLFTMIIIPSLSKGTSRGLPLGIKQAGLAYTDSSGEQLSMLPSSLATLCEQWQ